jgi:hypothetical protein
MAATLDLSVDYVLGLTDEPHGFASSGELSDDEQAVVLPLRVTVA